MALHGHSPIIIMFDTIPPVVFPPYPKSGESCLSSCCPLPAEVAQRLYQNPQPLMSPAKYDAKDVIYSVHMFVSICMLSNVFLYRFMEVNIYIYYIYIYTQGNGYRCRTKC